MSDSRDRFEAWYLESGYGESVVRDVMGGDGEYFSMTQQLMWEAWQACEASHKEPLACEAEVEASREFVVELNPLDIDACNWIDDVKTAIEKAGGRVK